MIAGSKSRHLDRELSVPAPTSNPTTTTPILPQLCQSTGCSSYPSGPRRPLAVRGPGLRLHLAPRLYPCPRSARPGGPGRRLGGGSTTIPRPVRSGGAGCSSHSSRSSPTRTSTASRSTERRSSCPSRIFRWAGRRSSSSTRRSACPSSSVCSPRWSSRASAGSGTGSITRASRSASPGSSSRWSSRRTSTAWPAIPCRQG